MKNWNEWAKENTDPKDATKKPQALDDIKVLDLSQGSFAGIFASSLLSEMGAEVVRVEPPGGDISREMTPEGLKINETGLAYLVEGRNKYHITLDVKKDKGLEILEDMLPKFDILIETFPSKYLEKRGLDRERIETINPWLIHCAINNYGQEGPMAEDEGIPETLDYDVITQALSGFAWTVGLPEDYTEFPEHSRVPTRMGNWMGWYAGGAMAAFSIMAALLNRDMTGEGQFMDISPAEALMSLNNYAFHLYHLTGQVINRVANFEPAAYAYNYVQAKDGLVFLAGYADANWKALCSIIDRPDLVEKYPTLKDRTTASNFIPMTTEIEKFTKQKTRDEILKIWLDYKGPGVTVAGEILKPHETIKLDHWFERGSLVKIKDRDYGENMMQGLPAKMSGSPPVLKWACRPVGADNEFIYRKFLGYDRNVLKELADQEIV